MNDDADGEIDYFATPGPTSDLTTHAESTESLPADAPALSRVVRGILLHDWTAMTNGIDLSGDRDGMAIFGATPIIDRVLSLDPAPLHKERPQEERLIGFCYHFALVHCALLLAKGVPARTRCGFANYLIPEKWTDHWVVEYWDGERWRLNDPQIGLDELSHDDFRDAARAWQLCRAGDADPADHGNGELWGWDELRGSLVNDLGALNKIEVGNWDWCELLRVEPLDQPHPDLDDQLASFAELCVPGRLTELHSTFDATTSIQPPSSLLATR